MGDLLNHVLVQHPLGVSVYNRDEFEAYKTRYLGSNFEQSGILNWRLFCGMGEKLEDSYSKGKKNQNWDGFK